MRIAVIGASGQTGIRIINEALSRGHDVLGLARSPHKITVEDTRLEVRPADVFDRESLNAGLAGADGVVSSVGKTNLKEKIPDFSTASHRNIIDAMAANGVRRLVVVSSFGAAPNVKRKGLRRNIYMFLRRKYYADMHAMERLVLEAPGIEATVVRAPMLHNRPPRHDWLLTNDGTLPAGLAISRDDLVRFLVEELETSANVARTVALADEGNEAPPMRELLARDDPPAA